MYYCTRPVVRRRLHRKSQKSLALYIYCVKTHLRPVMCYCNRPAVHLLCQDTFEANSVLLYTASSTFTVSRHFCRRRLTICTCGTLLRPIMYFCTRPVGHFYRRRLTIRTCSKRLCSETMRRKSKKFSAVLISYSASALSAKMVENVFSSPCNAFP